MQTNRTSNSMKNGYFLVFSTAFISGLAIFINRFGVMVLNPYVFTGLKNLIVALMLSGLIIGFKDWKILKNLNKKQWLMLISIGLLGGSIPFLLFFKGLSLTTAVKAAFLHKTMFIYVAVLAGLFLKEKIDKRFLLGGLILILANLVLFKKMSFSFNSGDLLILLAILFWAGENTLSKYALKNLTGRIVAWARMFFGSLFILLFLTATGQLGPLAGLTTGQLGWLAITAVFLFGYVMTWYSGLKYVPVSKATVILLLGSAITAFLSFIWTGQITLQTVLAAFLIVLGIFTVFGLKNVYSFIKGSKLWPVKELD